MANRSGIMDTDNEVFANEYDADTIIKIFYEGCKLNEGFLRNLAKSL